MLAALYVVCAEIIHYHHDIQKEKWAHLAYRFHWHATTVPSNGWNNPPRGSGDGVYLPFWEQKYGGKKDAEFAENIARKAN